MRSRLAIIGTLALGMLLSTSGAGLAISGFAGSDQNASQSQYGRSVPTPAPGTGVLGEEDTGGPAGGGGVAPAAGSGPGGGDAGVQPARQVEAGVQSSGDEQLPFTGFAAMPILLGGIVLLTIGFVLRRRVGPQEG